MARVFFISTVNGCSEKKKKRSLFCAALVAGTINKLEQSILRLRYLWILRTEKHNKSENQIFVSKTLRHFYLNERHWAH
jgi:hypothetical protein